MALGATSTDKANPNLGADSEQNPDARLDPTVQAARAAPLMGDAPREAATPAQSRARFFSSAHAFNLKLGPVPRGSFRAEHARALEDGAATQAFAMDQSAAMGLHSPATTPLVLSRYLRINTGESLTTHFAASAEIYYVLQGAGETRVEDGGAEPVINWSTGDVFFLPGGARHEHTATTGPGVLWSVTNEPALALEGLQAAGTAEVEAVHFPAQEIEYQLEVLLGLEQQPGQAGVALIFAQARQLARRNICPSLTLALNTLEPGGSQRAHVHNSVAVTLCLQGKGCYSMIDGERVDWADGVVSVTPPGAAHSHHNDGPSPARFLIVQDGGLHYHCRTMGFKFTE